MKNIIGVAFCAILFFGCDAGNTNPDPVDTTISEARTRWKSYNIHSYTITQQLICFCATGITQFNVVVTADTIKEVIDLSTNKPVQIEFMSSFKTIDSLFAFIEQSKNQNPAQLNAEYDSVFGYPKYIYVDYSAMMADEEMGYATKNLVTF